MMLAKALIVRRLRRAAVQERPAMVDRPTALMRLEFFQRHRCFRDWLIRWERQTRPEFRVSSIQIALEVPSPGALAHRFNYAPSLADLPKIVQFSNDGISRALAPKFQYQCGSDRGRGVTPAPKINGVLHLILVPGIAGRHWMIS